MSRIGLSPIKLPRDVTAELSDDTLTIKGKLGSLDVKVSKNIIVDLSDNMVKLRMANNKKSTRQLWGTIRSLINQATIGVDKGYKKQIGVTGVGYRILLKESTLILQLGFSHDVKYSVPSDVNISVHNNVITAEGTSAQRVGQVASELRSYRPPEPYKGKGLFYIGERILRKEGKKK